MRGAETGHRGENWGEMWREGRGRGGGGLPQGLNQVEISEFMQLHESMEDLDVELVSAGEKRDSVPSLTHTSTNTFLIRTYIKEIIQFCIFFT